MARGHVWKFILVPFAYGIAGPAGILIGTNIGAGQGGRALRTAWITWPLPALAAEAIGLAAATWPAAWIGSFSGDPAVLAIGTITMRRWDSTRCVRGEAAGGPGLHVDDVTPRPLVMMASVLLVKWGWDPLRRPDAAAGARRARAAMS